MPLKIAITGASGLIGSALCTSLSTAGHTVLRVSRSAKTGDIVWEPAHGQIDSQKLEGLDCVVHLAGHNIAARRWSSAEKQKISASRIDGTTLLCSTLAKLKSPPHTLISASAIGIYGDRGDEELNESSTLGEGFLADVCKQWEAATEPARLAGIRVVIPRFGVVLSPNGGALKKMLIPFRLGLGGRIGSGSQYISWIAIEDVVGALFHLLLQMEISGVLNFTAPGPVTNLEFTRALGAALRRPTILPVPASILRLVLGELADATLLASTRAMPDVLRNRGYKFKFSRLDTALQTTIGKET